MTPQSPIKLQKLETLNIFFHWTESVRNTETEAD